MSAPLKKWFSIAPRAAASDAAEISIFGDIGGWDVNADQFHRELKALGPVSAITLKINSYGGSVIDAYAIHNMLLDTGAQITARVYGVAASAASYIALAASRVEMYSNALFHIHEAWGIAIGTASELRQEADFLEQNSDMMLAKYASRAGMTTEDLKAKLTAEGGDWWMSGQQAVDAGFAAVVLDQQVALAAFAAIDTRRFSRMPDAIPLSAEATPPVEPETAPVAPPAEASPEAPATPAEPEAPAAVEPPAPEAPPAEPTGQEEPQAFVAAATESLKRSRATRAQVEALEAQVAQRDTRIAELEAASAELTTLKASVNELRAEIARHQAEQKTLAVAAAEVAATHGLSPAAAALLPSPTSAEQVDHLAVFEGITDPGERQAYYAAHKAAIKAAQRAQ